MRRTVTTPDIDLPRPARELAGGGCRAAPAALVLLATLLGAACRGGDDAGSVTTRDSAGIRIVESSAPVWGSGEGWRVGEVIATIGTVDGPREQQLHRVRGAVRLGDGTIVIADGGSSELRWYAPDGRHLRTAGRPGDGPGEFRGLVWIGRGRADSVYAWDGTHARLSVFTPDGVLARDFRPPLPERTVSPVVHAALGDGSVLLSRGPTWESDERRIGVQRPAMLVSVIAPDGAVADSIGPFPGESVYLRPGRRDGEFIRAAVPFGAKTMVAALEDGIVVADGAEYSVRVFDSAGELRRIIRRAHSPMPVTAADIAAYQERVLSDMPPIEEIRAGMRALLGEVPSPESMAAFGGVLVDEYGHVWVEQTRRTGDDPPVWSIFDREGRWLGQVDTPPDTRVLAIGGDWLLGHVMDDLDVEYVLLLRLQKE